MLPLVYIVFIDVFFSFLGGVCHENEKFTVRGKIKAVQFIKPPAQGSSSSTWGVVHREFGFTYRNLIRAAQSRLSEIRGGE